MPTTAIECLGLIPGGLLGKRYARQSLSFPNAFIGNPEETLTGPLMETFGGDKLWDKLF